MCRKNKQRRTFFFFLHSFFSAALAVCLLRASEYQLTLSSLLTRVLTGDDAGDFGQKALDSADGNSTCFVILHSRNDVFNLSKGRKDLEVFAKQRL